LGQWLLWSVLLHFSCYYSIIQNNHRPRIRIVLDERLAYRFENTQRQVVRMTSMASNHHRLLWTVLNSSPDL